MRLSNLFANPNRGSQRVLFTHWRLAVLAAVLISGVAVSPAQAQIFVGFNALSDTVREDSGTYQVKVSLTATSTSVVTVQYAVTSGTASSPKDYSIPAGNSGTVV